MKRFALIIALLIITSASFAQPIQIGVKGGLSIMSTDITNIESLQSKIKSRDVGFTVGLVSRITIPIVGIYIQPELTYNHSSYKVTDANGALSKLSYNNLELPVLVGIKLLFLRINAGPVFNLKTFEKSSDNYKIQRPNFGYQAGAGLSLGKIDIDVRYQGYLSKRIKDFKLGNIGDELKVNKGFWLTSLTFFF